MSKVNVDMAGFGDLIISLLLDKITNLDEIYTESESFNDISKEMRGRGLKASLLQYWFETDSQSRTKYKRMKRALESGNKVYINITPSKEKPDEEPEEDMIDKLTGKLGKAGKILNKIRMKESLDEDEKEFARQLVKESMEE